MRASDEKWPAASTFGAGTSRGDGENGLLAILERRRIDARARLELRIVETEPRREEVEPAVGGERRARHDGRRRAAEEILAQNRREVERHASTRSRRGRVRAISIQRIDRIVVAPADRARDAARRRQTAIGASRRASR